MSISINLHVFDGCFHCTISELSSCDQELWPAKLKICILSPFRESLPSLIYKNKTRNNALCEKSQLFYKMAPKTLKLQLWPTHVVFLPPCLSQTELQIFCIVLFPCHSSYFSWWENLLYQLPSAKYFLAQI